jgi:hypothetical protein
MTHQIYADELEAIERRSRAASGETWEATRLDDSTLGIRVVFASGTHELLRLMRDLHPATAADVEFVAAARQDIQRLIGALRSGEPLGDRDLDDIARRCQAASPGPWRPFLESAGGLGGSSVIWVSDREDEPDLYVWLGATHAPDADFEFVATARQDIPRLLEAVRGLAGPASETREERTT